MKTSFAISFFLILFWAPSISKGQEKKFQYQILGVVTEQSDNSYTKPFQIGGGLGFGIYREVKLGRFGLEGSALYLDHKEKHDDLRNTYEGISLNARFNFLVKTVSLGERRVYLGPALGICKPLNGEGDYYGPSLGAGAKALVPVRISGFPFYLTYDFEYITIQGYSRNSIGVSFWP
ncbi:hypothetical protein J0A68_20270 [Algoriphagus sp. H41]|uniref:Outer membrane protein beta-barrel domain-containing protein n=1 Tax=Algoriphagus oliviformis TaxID=2811231 RepID=A0ABS3CAX2_9BACT|nr:hypothetical protein [Algoriphagus oliviformis]MBN7813301.1 hypothetical protein [Algoriphagus oliviformis]